MKNKIANSLKFLLVFSGLSMLMVSCGNDIVRDADYPAESIYMPSALKGIYIIDNVPSVNSSVPTTGNTYQFSVDSVNKKLIVPMGVYRSATINKGTIDVSVTANTDTINKLISTSKLTATELLPSDKYILMPTVKVQDGNSSGSFDLSIDLDFLKANINKKYAIAVGISSNQCIVRSALATTIVVINTRFLKATSSFTSVADGTNSKKIVFTNTSAYGVKYSWNFGDGAGVSSDKSPSYTYAVAGTYTVTLTTVGVTGISDKTVTTSLITVL